MQLIAEDKIVNSSESHVQLVAEDIVDSNATVSELIDAYCEYPNTVMSRSYIRAKLRCHLLGPTVTDEEIFEGLEYSHRRCEGPPGNFHARYPKQTFLTVLVRNSLDLTRGKNRGHFKRLVKAYPGLATDLSNGILYYVYHEKMG
jgi:hypothetical protein